MALAKDGWERTDFPIVCETCLGDNPYIRMVSKKQKTKTNSFSLWYFFTKTEPLVLCSM
jgi:hypothetical protein